MRQWLYIIICIVLVVQGVAARTKTTQANLQTAAIVLDIIDSPKTAINSDSMALSDSIDQSVVTLRGFSKKASDSKETFMVTNNSAHRISAIHITLRYTTLDGSMIHERNAVIPIILNPGDTQIATIKSFDTQRLFYYYAGPKPRKNATPFKVAYRLTGYDIPIGH